MGHPPRNPKKPIFNKKILSLSALQGIFSLLVIMLLYSYSFNIGFSDELARTLSFIALISSNLFLILTNRSWSKNIISSFSQTNKALYLIIAVALFFLTSVIYIPFFQKTFYFTNINPLIFLTGIATGFFTIAWFELLKFFANKRNLNLLD